MLNTIFKKIGLSAILHISVSYNICLTVALLASLSYGIIAACVAGLAKEISDHYEEGNYFSKKDLVMDAIGIILAVLILTIA